MRTLGVTHSHTDARVGNAANHIGFYIVTLTHHTAVLLTHVLGVDALVAGGRETVVDPEERAYLTALERSLQHLDAVGRQAHNLARPYIANSFII